MPGMHPASSGDASALPRSKWPALLVIMRHATTELNLKRLYQDDEVFINETRDADARLTDAGREEARKTGRYLNQYGSFDVLYVSPYVRTRDTAGIVLEVLESKPPLVLEERVREKEFGVLEGMSRGARKKFQPEEMDRRNKVGKYYYRPPGGESYPDVNLRLQSFLGTLVREHAGRRVLVVTHSVVVLLFRRLLERLEEKEVLDLDRHHEVKNASLLVYESGARDGREGVLVRKAWNFVP